MQDVLAKIVDIANELDAPLLWAGDAWERRRPSPAEVLIVQRQFARLTRGGVAIPGNHDVEAFERPTGYDLIGRGPEIVSMPQWVSIQDAAVACLPWAPPGKLRAQLMPELEDADALNDELAVMLIEIARGLYQAMPDDRPRILLAHWSVSGGSLPSGIPTDQLREPVLELPALAAIGFDAVVLGHIHVPQLLSEPDAPPIFYVGSPLPLNYGERDSDHCVWLLETAPPKIIGREAAAFQIPIESRRLVQVELEAGQLLEGVEMPFLPADVPSRSTAKIIIRGTRAEVERLDLSAIRSRFDEVAHVWSLQVELEREQVVRGAALDETIDDAEALELWLQAAGVDEAMVPALIGLHHERYGIGSL